MFPSRSGASEERPSRDEYYRKARFCFIVFDLSKFPKDRVSSPPLLHVMPPNRRAAKAVKHIQRERFRWRKTRGDFPHKHLRIFSTESEKLRLRLLRSHSSAWIVWSDTRNHLRLWDDLRGLLLASSFCLFRSTIERAMDLSLRAVNFISPAEFALICETSPSLRYFH